jgi:hypothetical protein
MYVDDVVEGIFHRLCIHEPHGQNAADRSMGLTAADVPPGRGTACGGPFAIVTSAPPKAARSLWRLRGL